MSTLILEVNSEQEKVLESLLKYMDISFEKVKPKGDFWDSISPNVKERIQKGLDDADAGRYSSANDFIGKLIAE
ncbi:hypothetical protein [Emticicia oligotrophica]|uniref:hypothetical protein n=1 Tax=Emticicia oligotrophica TaxID=312279 RepID=UPI00273C6548|nr:hypothetical protein [Emticicia oligotrophica]